MIRLDDTEIEKLADATGVSVMDLQEALCYGYAERKRSN